jgi:hypothetical protein
MKHLVNLCKPRQLDIDSDVLDISDLIQDRIDTVQFFDTNFKTQ